MNCGEKIAALRKSHNMTQAELGNAMNVTYQAVSKWERGDSEPDFDTMSKIAKFFDVPLSYFEEGGELPAPEAPAAPAESEAAQMLGVCTVCGRMLREGEEAARMPKLVCKECVNRAQEEAERTRVQKARQIYEEKDWEKKKLRRNRNAGLIYGSIPAGVIFIAFLVWSLIEDGEFFPFIFGSGCVLTVLGYTFTAQMIWDGTVREVCTEGGHIMTLPGIIFSLSPDGLLFLIFAKIFLAIIAAIVFVFSLFFCFFAAVVISPFTFIPALVWRNVKIARIK